MTVLLRHSLFVLVMAAFVGLWGWPGPAAARVFNPETFTLDNGMQVIVIPNHRVPVVNHMVWYRVGAADEPPGQTGIAHFLEHLMFKGTETRPAGVFSETVARNGGRENAFTSYDYTGYFQTIAKDRLPLVMEMEADRMNNLVLTPEIIEPERMVILEERDLRVENNPAAILGEQVDATLYFNHPYRRPIIGWEHEIRDLSVDGIMAFYEQWYVPNNAVLVIAGDVTADEVRPLAEKYYGAVPTRAAANHLQLSEPDHRAARRVTLRDDRVRQPAWYRHHLAPSYLTAEGTEPYALQVLANVLGGGTTSRLYRALVVDQELAVSAGAHYDASRRGPSAFSIYASPRPGVSLETIEAAVDAVIDEMLANGIDADELDRVKRRMRADAIYARDELSSGAQILGEAVAIGMDVNDVEAWPERIANVTAEEVAEQARAVLAGQAAVIAELRPSDDGGI